MTQELNLPVPPQDGAIYELATGEKWLYKTDIGRWCQVLKKTLGVREFLVYPTTGVSIDGRDAN